MLYLKIFLGKMIDVTLSTLSTMNIIKNKRLTASIIGSIDVLVWFIVVKEAITTNNNSILIPIFYALGYGVGTMLGLIISNLVIKSISTVIIITRKVKISKIILLNNYGGTIINTKGLKDNKNSYMIISQINSKKINSFKRLLYEYDKNVVIITLDSKYVLNAYL
ncbi:MAG: DUF2179 domain-containing protein [Bacilli bacterium]|nr:DUF2179 domain-containing protein [Bacilli bacterium]